MAHRAKGTTSTAMAIVLLAVCFLMGVLAIALSVRAYLQVRNIERSGQVATARVVEFLPVKISNVDDNGAASEYTEMVPLFNLEIPGNEGGLIYVKGLSSQRRFKVGDEVRVRYLRGHPEEAQMDGTDDGRTDLLGAGGSALFFWGSGVVVLLRWRAERRRTNVG